MRSYLTWMFVWLRFVWVWTVITLHYTTLVRTACEYHCLTLCDTQWRPFGGLPSTVRIWVHHRSFSDIDPSIVIIKLLDSVYDIFAVFCGGGKLHRTFLP
jgi:hypothetical protein